MICNAEEKDDLDFAFMFFIVQSGLGTEYFRILLQSNCGVSVLDFAPRVDGGDGSPYICLNRLNQVRYKFNDKDLYNVAHVTVTNLKGK